MNKHQPLHGPHQLCHQISKLTTRRNNITSHRLNIAGQWYCAYPSIRECAPPRDLCMEAFHVDEDDLLDLGLGRSIYSKVQVGEFLKFQDSQGTRRACLVETVKLACGSHREDEA